MNEIKQFTPTEISRDGRIWFDARPIHSYLKSGWKFADWIRMRISEIGAVEGVDYVIQEIQKNPLGGRPTLEYYVTPEMGQELGMLERNEKGREIRQWFIARNAKLTKIESEPASGTNRIADILDNPIQRNELILEMLQRHEKDRETIKAQSEKIAADAPKVAALERLSGSEGSFCVTDAAKMLKVQPKKLFSHLQATKWAYRRPGNSTWLAYQEKIQAQLLEHIHHEITKPNGEVVTRTQMKITSKGLARLSEELGGDLFN